MKYFFEVIVSFTWYNSIYRNFSYSCNSYWPCSAPSPNELLERVQGCDGKRIPSVKIQPYEERVGDYKKFVLEKRRLLGEFKCLNKCFNKFHNVDHFNLFTLQNNPRTRINSKTIKVMQFTYRQGRRRYFSESSTKGICCLPVEIVWKRSDDTLRITFIVELLVQDKLNISRRQQQWDNSLSVAYSSMFPCLHE